MVEITTLPATLQRVPPRWLIRFIIASSFLYGSLLIYGMHGYMHWHFRILKALEWPLLSHFTFWLATFETQGRLRFVVAAMMLPSMAGIFLLWWTLHLSVAFIALIGMGWLFLRVILGKRFEY
jgi:hypothetical protein